MSGFVRSPPTLPVYDIAHFLPLGGTDRDFPFTEMRSEVMAHASPLLLESPELVLWSKSPLEKIHTVYPGI